MAKLTAWLVTLVGVVLVLSLIAPTLLGAKISMWLVALAWLVVGIGKLMRNYNGKRR